MSIKEQIYSIIEKVDNEIILKHMLNIINEIYLLHITGRWGR